MDTSALSDFINQFLPTTWSSLLITCGLLVAVDSILRHKLKSDTGNSTLLAFMSRMTPVAINIFLGLLVINNLIREQYEGVLPAMATYAATRINSWYQSWDTFVDTLLGKIDQRFTQDENNGKQHDQSTGTKRKKESIQQR